MSQPQQQQCMFSAQGTYSCAGPSVSARVDHAKQQIAAKVDHAKQQIAAGLPSAHEGWADAPRLVELDESFAGSRVGKGRAK